ncbi:MAG: hypothetical protein J0I06_13745 [Planctomycetes bacterium]|nr:hypothetical protein [Planctomycetota bacterium]
MSEDKSEEDKPHIPSRGVSKPPTPKVIAARSQAWNSAAGIVILGGILLLLSVALFISLKCRAEHV